MGEGAGAEHADAAADDLEVRVGADHGQAGGVAGGQDGVERLGVRRVGVVVGAGVEQEGRARRVVDDVEVEALEHISVPRRAEVEHVAAEGPEPRVGAVAQRDVRRLAGGHDAVVVGGRDAHLGQLRHDRYGAAGGVGQHDDAFARGAQGGEAVGRTGIGADTVMDYAPKVEDQAVIVGGDVAEALDRGHASVPIACSMLAKPWARSAVASSRLMRGMAAGPS